MKRRAAFAVAFPLQRAGRRVRAGAASAALAWLVSCTLTQGDFRPLEVEARPVQGADASPVEAVGSEPGGSVVAMPAPGSSCVDSAECPGDRVCMDGTCVAPACVEGEGLSACAIVTCLDGSCEVSPSCADGAPGPAETDVDCGGPCGPCALGRACVQPSDCQDADCIAGICTQPTCVDGVANQDETDVDCGGSCAACVVAPSCTDGVRNQTEAGVDCGGPCPANCADGDACAGREDCASGVCSAGGCGPGVARCCQAPTCEDGVANGTEPVEDCGDAQCGPCALERRCTADVQCQSGFCEGGTCRVRLVCGDGIRNGNEGDVDCGGTEDGCPRCGDGLVCRADADCASGDCFAGGCVSCADGEQNGDETGVDCGGVDSACPVCPPVARCNEFNSVDLQTVGVTVRLPADSCAKISQFLSYPPTLFETGDSGPFPLPFSWVQECSGQQATSTLDRPFQQHTLTGLSTACPVIFDFQGSTAELAVRWF